MKLSSRVAVVLALVFLTTSSAWAVGFGYGLKVGYGPTFYPDDEVNPIDDGSAWTVAAVLDVELPVVGLEANLMWTRCNISDRLDDMYYDYLGIVALAKVGLSLIPAVLDLDFGVGLDYRFLVNVEGMPDGDGTILMLPIALQLVGDLRTFKLHGEIRFNYGLKRSIEYDWAADMADSENIHELLFLAGVTF